MLEHFSRLESAIGTYQESWQGHQLQNNLDALALRQDLIPASESYRFGWMPDEDGSLYPIELLFGQHLQILGSDPLPAHKLMWELMVTEHHMGRSTQFAVITEEPLQNYINLPNVHVISPSFFPDLALEAARATKEPTVVLMPNVREIEERLCTDLQLATARAENSYILFDEIDSREYHDSFLIRATYGSQTYGSPVILFTRMQQDLAHRAEHYEELHLKKRVMSLADTLNGLEYQESDVLLTQIPIGNSLYEYKQIVLTSDLK